MSSRLNKLLLIHPTIFCEFPVINMISYNNVNNSPTLFHFLHMLWSHCFPRFMALFCCNRGADTTDAFTYPASVADMTLTVRYKPSGTLFCSISSGSALRSVCHEPEIQYVSVSRCVCAGLNSDTSAGYMILYNHELRNIWDHSRASRTEHINA